MHFKRMGVLNGVADYLAFAGRRGVAIELKDEDGEQRKDQQQFQRRWEAAGNWYYVVRTVDEFRTIVTALAIFGG